MLLCVKCSGINKVTFDIEFSFVTQPKCYKDCILLFLALQMGNLVLLAANTVLVEYIVRHISYWSRIVEQSVGQNSLVVN